MKLILFTSHVFIQFIRIALSTEEEKKGRKRERMEYWLRMQWEMEVIFLLTRKLKLVRWKNRGNLYPLKSINWNWDFFKEHLRCFYWTKAIVAHPLAFFHLQFYSTPKVNFRKNYHCQLTFSDQTETLIRNLTFQPTKSDLLFLFHHTREIKKKSQI